MENSCADSCEFSSFIQIGNEKYEIVKHEEKSTTSKISIEKILENISYLKEKSDVFTQKIIDNNKFLIQQEKNLKKDDEDLNENFGEEN